MTKIASYSTKTEDQVNTNRLYSIAFVVSVCMQGSIVKCTYVLVTVTVYTV